MNFKIALGNIMNLSSFVKELIIIEAQGKNTKQEIELFFRKRLPIILILPMYLCLSFTGILWIFFRNVWCSITLLPIIIILIWWLLNKKYIQNSLYFRAKQRYNRMADMCESVHIPKELFLKAFPTWECGINSNFEFDVLLFFQKYAPKFSHKERKEFVSNNIQEALNLFGFKKLEDISESKLKKIYRTKVKQYHPDMHPGDKQAEDKFKQISQAYDVLVKAIS